MTAPSRTSRKGSWSCAKTCATPFSRSRGAAWEATLTTAVGECFASVPGAPGGIGFALAAHWQGALIWWAFDAQRPLDNYLNESLRTLISLLLRSPVSTRNQIRSETGQNG